MFKIDLALVPIGAGNPKPKPKHIGSAELLVVCSCGHARKRPNDVNHAVTTAPPKGVTQQPKYNWAYILLVVDRICGSGFMV